MKHRAGRSKHTRAPGLGYVPRNSIFQGSYSSNSSEKHHRVPNRLAWLCTCSRFKVSRTFRNALPAHSLITCTHHVGTLSPQLQSPSELQPPAACCHAAAAAGGVKAGALFRPYPHSVARCLLLGAILRFRRLPVAAILWRHLYQAG